MESPAITALSASRADLESFVAELIKAGYTVDTRNGAHIDQCTRTVIAYPQYKVYCSYTLWAADLGATVKTLVLADAISAAIA